MRRWRLRALTSLVEFAALAGAFVWAGWAGALLFCAGAILIGTNRAVVDRAEGLRR